MKVKEATIKIVYDTELDNIERIMNEVFENDQDTIVSVELISETERDATEDECESMCWEFNEDETDD